jgi:hypothetical protein
MDVSLDRYVLFFTFGVATLTGVLFGLAPALNVSKPDPGNMLKEGGRGASQGGRNWMRSALIVSFWAWRCWRVLSLRDEQHASIRSLRCGLNEAADNAD